MLNKYINNCYNFFKNFFLNDLVMIIDDMYKLK